MTSPDPFPIEGRVRLVGVGRKVTGAVPSLSCPASQVPQCCYSIRDGGAVIGVSGWDPGHIHCGKEACVTVVLDIVLGPAKIMPVVLSAPAGGVVIAGAWYSARWHLVGPAD